MQYWELHGFVELSAVGEDTNPLLLDFGKLFLE